MAKGASGSTQSIEPETLHPDSAAHPLVSGLAGASRPQPERAIPPAPRVPARLYASGTIEVHVKKILIAAIVILAACIVARLRYTSSREMLAAQRAAVGE